MNGINADTTDDRLMELAANGNAEAFDVLVGRYQHLLQRFAVRMLGGDSATGADIAVIALVRLWECRHRFRACGQLRAWLLKTVHRLCLDQSHQRCPPSSDLESDSACAGPGIQSVVERTALAQAVRDCIAELPEGHRSVLLLSSYEGLTYEEIAEVLEIPAGTVASRKHHSIAMLRRQLAAWKEQ